MASPGVAPGLALVIGAACGLRLNIPVALGLWLLPGLAGVAAVLWWRGHERPCLGLTTTAFALCGALLAADARDAAYRPALRGLLDRELPGFAMDTLGPPPVHDPLAVRIRLTEDASPAPAVTTLRAEALAVRLGGRWQTVGGGLILSVGGAPARRRGADWVAGRTLELPVTFRRPARFLNEGVPDVERDLALDGTALVGSVKSGLLVEVRARGRSITEAAARVRRHVREVVDRRVGRHDPRSAAIVTAVLIGDRTGLPDDVRLRLQAAGTYHVIAISGGNIAIFAALCLGLARLVGAAGRPAAALTLLMLAGYALVVTAGASVWRATLMAGVYLAARLLDHRSPPWHALAATAAVVVCLRPLEVRDVGCLLTFGATAALLDVAHHARTWTPRRRIVGWVVTSLAASLAVEVALLPVSARVFSRVTSAGLVLNLLAVPLMGLVQVAGMAAAVADGVGIVADMAGWMAHGAARALIDSARLVEWLPWLSARVPPPALLTVVVYYAACAGLRLGHGRLRAVSAGSFVVALVVIVSGAAGPPSPIHRSAPLRLTVFDVGQGDALLLQSADGGAVLVDAGGVPFGGARFDIGARVLAPALWARGVRRLDALVLTHGDPDHMGGARAILGDVPPAQIWEGIPVPGHAGLAELLELARARGVPVVRRLAGDRALLGGAQVRVLHPPAADWERPRVRNDDSVVLEVRYGDVAMLLTGDIGAGVEQAVLPQLAPARVRILKVGHHGSRTSSSRALLEGWRPQIALVSVGRGNTFGHPAPEVLERLAAIGARVYRTDRHGQISLETDGARVTVRTFVSAGVDAMF